MGDRWGNSSVLMLAAMHMDSAPVPRRLTESLTTDFPQATINQHLVPGTDLIICREYGNAYDANACMVITAQGGHDIGYVPKLLNQNFQQGLYMANVAQIIPNEQRNSLDVLIYVQNNGQPIIAAPILDVVELARALRAQAQ
jgi:hypothetical protein